VKRGDLVIWKKEKDSVGVVLQINNEYCTVFWPCGILAYLNFEKKHLGVINGKG